MKKLEINLRAIKVVSKKKTESWYAVKSVLQHKLNCNFGNRPKYTYEERIVLIKASSFDKAMARAEREIEVYCRNLECKNTGYLDVYHLFDSKIGDLTEVFSVMHRSNLTSQKYLRCYSPADIKNCKKMGYDHLWYNFDNQISKCYNCASTRKGKIPNGKYRRSKQKN